MVSIAFSSFFHGKKWAVVDAFHAVAINGRTGCYNAGYLDCLKYAGFSQSTNFPGDIYLID